MTQPEKEQLAELFRRKLPEVPAIEEMIATDIKTIEPFIDALVREAEDRGRFEAYLEIAEAREREARVAAKFDRRAMDETPVPF